MVWDSRASPSSEVRTSSGVPDRVCDSVSNEAASWPVSIWSTVVDSPANDPGVGVELLLPARHQGHVLRAQHGLDLDGRLAAVADEGVLDPELDGDRAVLQLEALDLADLHPGDPHRVVGLEARGLGELRAVDRAATDDRQRRGVERQQHEHDDHAEADPADDRGVAVPEGLGLPGHQLHP
jgi:hypothetical protein